MVHCTVLMNQVHTRCSFGESLSSFDIMVQIVGIYDTDPNASCGLSVSKCPFSAHEHCVGFLSQADSGF